ncbi:MAG TPA: DUF6625 family protein [Pseudomonadales bacterium]|nr:DUF6625 family protein [Pseudomonadales bacterium]
MQSQFITIIPFFGRWPFWMDLFLLSAERNPQFHWLFHTDCGIPASAPANIRFVETTFERYQQKVRDALKTDYYPEHAYKLCDIKPMLGYIHADEIRHYDYWGIGDIDLIHGQLAPFVSQFLPNYKLLSLMADRICGHMTWFRNEPLYNEGFRQIPEWQTLLATNKHFSVTERRYTKVFLKHRKFPLWLSKLLYPGNALLKEAFFLEAYTTPNAEIDWSRQGGFPTEWAWRNGQISNDLNTSTPPYFHFMKWKDLWKGAPSSQFMHVSLEQARAEGFRINEKGFFPLKP